MQACFQLLEDVTSTVPSNDFSFETMVVPLVCDFSQQLFQSVSPSRHRDIMFSKARGRAEVVPTIPHVKYPLILCTSVAVLRQVQLQNFPLTQVDGALLAVVRMVVPHLHVAQLIDTSRVGEDVINRCAQLRCLEDPLYEHGVGVGYDYAVNGAFMFQNKCEQVCHPSCEGDGLHHTAEPVRTDLLLPCTHIRGDNESSLAQGWANILTRRPQLLPKFDRGAGPGTDGVFWYPTS